MELDLADGLYRLHPNLVFGVHDNDYDTIEWDEEINGIPKPSKEEILASAQQIVDERPMVLLREKRDKLLTKSDIYTLPDYPHPTPEIRQAWLDYRQSLRDITQTVTPTLNEYDDLNNVVWPTPPQ